MINRILFILIFLLSFFLNSCELEEDKSKVLARVYDKELHFDDIDLYFSANISKEDSIKIINNYINQWVKQQVLINQAENNIFVDELNIEKRVEDYRNTLIIHEYQQKLINQKLDTNVSFEQIEEYYENNSDEFKLRDNIVKVAYVKLKRGDNNLSVVRRIMRSYNEEEDFETLYGLAESNAENYFLNKKAWILLDDLLLEVPIKTNNQSQYLKKHSFIQLRDDDYTYLVYFIDYKLKGDTSPLGFVSPKITSIIINQRKIELINQMEKDVVDKAINDGELEIFTPVSK